METIIFDACSLIYITKISLKEIIISRFSNIMITNSIKKEVLFDFKKYNEAQLIKQNLDSKKIMVQNIKDKKLINNLGTGESEAISLAKKESAILITDDKLPLNIALKLDIKVKTSETLLLYLLKKNVIDHDVFIKKINLLNEFKMLKPEILQFIVKEGEKYK